MRSINIVEACIFCNSSRLSSSPAVLMPFIAKRVFGHEPIEITSEWGMRDLKPGTSYFPAKSMQCQECGTLFLDYRFDNQQMDALYKDYRGVVYTQQRDFYEPGYASGVGKDFTKRHTYIAEIEAWLRPKLPRNSLVLDYGGGDGLNSPFLENETVHVYDISGVTVVKGVHRISLNQIADNSYDLVANLQVLEHVSSPLELLREIRLAMSPNTLLYVEVPHEKLMRENFGKHDLGQLKRFWHEHINFYTEIGLRHLCTRAGLLVLGIHYQHFDNGVRSGEVMAVLAQIDPTSDFIENRFD